MSNTSIITRRLLVFGMICLVAGAMPTTLRAADTDGNLVPGDPNDFVLLSNLTSNEPNSVSVGDKVFSMFSYTPVGDMPAAGDVKVFGFLDADNNFGLSLHGSFLDLPGGAVASSASLIFNVAVGPGGLQQGLRISDSHLFLNGQGIDDTPVGSVVSVDESFDAPPSDTLHVALSNLTGSEESTQHDSAIFSERFTSLRTTAVILASAGEGTNQPARTTAVDFTFSQTVVPEPATALLMLAGCGSLLLGRRR